jgi:tRNA(Met) C34 N-acetyltransferase TmcA
MISHLLGTGKSKTIAGIVMKLLPKLAKNIKILLCAPSNTACDELSKRILNEINSNNKTGHHDFFLL